ncbi:MAG: CotH kinase family protein [Chitinispirillaceae bacterium]|nr:CotH kinase family protein [Chitinispirillaceae bacterium]
MIGKRTTRGLGAAGWVVVGIIVGIGAQDIDLQGRVVDQNGQPVAGALVELVTNGLSFTTAENGLFQLEGTVTGAANKGGDKASRFIALNRKFLELGSVTDAVITVFSIRGVLLNRLAVKEQIRIPVDRIIPPAVHSQAVVLSIVTGRQTVRLKAIGCGGQWQWDGTLISRACRKNGEQRNASVPAVDTLTVDKEGKQRVALPISGLVAVLNDIVVYNIFEPNPENLPPNMIGDVVFSEPSMTFKGQLSITMSTTITGAEIRYTVDGSLPTAASTPYDGTPVAVSATTQLRAAAFKDGASSGRPSTAIYVARSIDVTSDVPLIVMDGYGKGKPTKDKSIYLDLAFMTFEPVNGVASIAAPPTLATRAGYHLRGQSSMSFKQAPYKIELWDNNSDDADYPVLGMPPGADWALISPFTDNTLIRNVFVFSLAEAMGLAAMQYRFAEVYINQDSLPLDTSDYQGVYTLIQTIKNKKGRLDLKQLRPDDTDPAKLSGGYIMKFDQMAMDTSEVELACTGSKKMSGGFGGGRIDSTATCWDDLELVDPAPANSLQIAWITDYCQQFHNALHEKPAGNWKQFIDMPSFVNLFIVNEITRNVDAWIRSHYMHKERGGPLTAGPVWDYNFALNNFARDTVGWHVEENRRGSNDWHTLIWKQPEFKSAVKARWNELRPTLLSDAAVARLVDEVRAPIVNAAERNLIRWPVDSSSLFGRGFGNDTLQPKTWTGQIDTLKAWTKRRMKSLDSSMATLP